MRRWSQQQKNRLLQQIAIAKMSVQWQPETSFVRMKKKNPDENYLCISQPSLAYYEVEISMLILNENIA